MSQAVNHVRHEIEAVSGPSGETVESLSKAFERLRRGYESDPYPSLSTRLERLERLLAAVIRNQEAIARAVSDDFGNRSTYETRIAEVFMVVSGIRYIKRHLKSWMKSERRNPGMTFLPGSARVHYQPLGVVGIIAPWNYPFQLAIAPLAYALAAGNRVLVKPSEYTPKTAALLQRFIADIFEPDVADVVVGGADVGEAFAGLPFDHLLFTGSTEVGRRVMKAAAENLTPVTLELGGKSPAIVHESYPIDRAAARIAYGKWLNAGQTCIAPDYLLVHESKATAMVDELAAHVARYYPTLSDNPDYTSIVNDRHYNRLDGLIRDAVKRGAKKVEINPDGARLSPEKRKMAPTILTGVDDDMAVMQEEIFGPVLPIVTYRTVDDAVEYVNARPRPLALYVFDRDERRAANVLERTVSGGACVNDTVLHFGVDDLPFGGVGPSGMGAYHGREGFDRFSHKKGVFYQAKWNAAGMLAPPYGEKIDRLLKTLIGKA